MIIKYKKEKRLSQVNFKKKKKTLKTVHNLICRERDRSDCLLKNSYFITRKPCLPGYFKKYLGLLLQGPFQIGWVS